MWAARKPARVLHLPRAMALRRGRQRLNRSWSLLATGEGSDRSELGILLQIAPTSVSRGCDIKPLSLYSALPSAMALPNSDSPAFKKKKKKAQIKHLADLISHVMWQMAEPELGSRHHLSGACKQS